MGVDPNHAPVLVPEMARNVSSEDWGFWVLGVEGLGLRA